MEKMQTEPRSQAQMCPILLYVDIGSEMKT